MADPFELFRQSNVPPKPRSSISYSPVASVTTSSDVVAVHQAGAVPVEENSAADKFPLTNTGNAEFFAQRFSGRVAYRHDLRQWLIWRSPVWRPDVDAEVWRLALEAVRERQRLALGIADADKKKQALRFLLGCEDDYRLRSMLVIAGTLTSLAKSGVEFDRRDDLLAVENGVIEMQTGEFREGRPGDYLTQCAAVAYDPQATAPRWERFVNEIFGGDEELAAFLQRAVGYTLTGWTLEQVFFFCYGSKGANGKSTLFEVLRALLGDFATNTSFETFAGDAYKGSHQESLMVLENARLVTALESSHAGGLNEAVVKIVTGGDPLTGSRKYQRTRTFMPKFKLWLAANSLPRVKDVSPAFWRRVILLPFLERFEGERADKHLSDKLKSELPGILNWALAGCAAYQQQGLNPPRRCADAAEAWRVENDPLAEFLSTCKTGPREEVQASELYASYERWCIQNGVAQAVKNPSHFSRLVQAHGFERARRANGRFFVGIATNDAK